MVFSPDGGLLAASWGNHVRVWRWRSSKLLGDVSAECFFFQAEDGIRDVVVTGVQTCALPICRKVEYMLPQQEPLLKETLGVIVYQEQVMRIANVLASYSLGEADLLRRAMGKKNAEAMAEQRDRFMSGAAALGHPKAPVVEVFDQMAKFSGYGFNKSHSAAYALVAYQTAYLKTHYPVEFMAALLTSEISKPENVVKYIGECKEIGIRVEPPDVQLSGAQFTPNSSAEKKGIGFGLA